MGCRLCIKVHEWDEYTVIVVKTGEICIGKTKYSGVVFLIDVYAI